jgi:3',5'-cyclic AMP phosphodiesterase CpdA
MRRRLAFILAGALLAVAPIRSQTEPFFFVQFSDPQFGFFTGDGDFSQETANLEFAVASVNRLKPAFVVITGDLVNKPGDAAQIAEYQRVVAKILPSIPVHQMPGNHDIENVPTPATVAAYRTRFGPDRYRFQYRNLVGIVLNSTLIHSPDKAQEEAAAQEVWLRLELERAKASGARHILVFQHHPWFLASPSEADQYFNIPLARRTPLLTLFREAGVRTLVSGHYHRNAVASDAGLEAITTGPVGRPLGDARSGFRVFFVSDAGITHQYVEFGNIPTTINPAAGRVGGPGPN